MKKLVLAGIGGNIADVYHKAFEQMGDCGAKVVAGIDPSGKDNGFGVPVFPSWEKFRDAGVEADALEVLTPPHTHKKLVLQGLAAGLHVSVEKPAAPTVADCEEMIAAAQKAGKTLFFCYHTRYATGIAELAERLKGKTFEEIRILYVENVLDYRAPGTTDLRPGCLWDSAINAFSVMTAIAPDLGPFTIDSATAWKGGAPEVLTGASVVFGWKGGSGWLQQEWKSPQGNTVRVLTFRTSDGNVYNIDVHHQKVYENGKAIIESKPGAYILEYAGQQSHFLDCIDRGVSHASIEPVEIIAAIEKKLGINSFA